MHSVVIPLTRLQTDSISFNCIKYRGRRQELLKTPSNDAIEHKWPITITAWVHNNNNNSTGRRPLTLVTSLEEEDQTDGTPG